jgi:branched-chain amino acid transport system substrate-binding protein
MRKYLSALAIATAFMAIPAAQPLLAQDGPARIALIHGMSGSPLEAFSRRPAPAS